MKTLITFILVAFVLTINAQTQKTIKCETQVVKLGDLANQGKITLGTTKGTRIIVETYVSAPTNSTKAQQVITQKFAEIDVVVDETGATVISPKLGNRQVILGDKHVKAHYKVLVPSHITIH